MCIKGKENFQLKQEMRSARLPVCLAVSVPLTAARVPRPLSPSLSITTPGASLPSLPTDSRPPSSLLSLRNECPGESASTLPPFALHASQEESNRLNASHTRPSSGGSQVENLVSSTSEDRASVVVTGMSAHGSWRRGSRITRTTKTAIHCGRSSQRPRVPASTHSTEALDSALTLPLSSCV